tara:strand:+ start:27 stop:236 length:210 start_codon:yes stop_codon:yes gene_type:complete
MLIQLDLFNEMSEIDILEEKVKMLEKSLEKQRKALFARHGLLCKQYMELNDRFNVLERALCKGKFGNLD